jgi:hypothetical protein
MSQASTSACVRGEIGGESGSLALRAAGVLSLAAAPTFALMALLTGAFDAGADLLCAVAHHASPLSGMVVMYLLMSAFHAGPWLKLLAARRAGPRGA